MKVLFICHSAAPSGAELSLLRLASAMKDDAPTVLFTDSGPIIEQFRQREVKVITTSTALPTIKRFQKSPFLAAKAFQAYFALGWRLGDSKDIRAIDVIIARSVKSLLVGWPLSKRLGKPLVWSVHDRISPTYLGRLTAALIRTLGLIVASGYIANSQSTLNSLWKGTKPSLVVNPGLELSQHESRQKLSTSGQRLVVAMVGRLTHWKGQHVFIESFSSALGGTSAQGLIVGGALFGENDYAASLHEQVNGSSAAEQIHFLGHVDDVSSILASVDILVHASIEPEPFGAVIIEGMNAGCAVIATAPGGPTEIITNGVDGLLVPCGDVSALTKALAILAEDASFRKQLSAAAKIRARDFDIVEQARRLSLWLRHNYPDARFQATDR